MKPIGLLAFVFCTCSAAHQGDKGPIPPGDFQKASERLLEYAREVVPSGSLHNKWIRRSSGGGTYEPPYVSVGMGLTDGSSVSGLVNVSTGAVKDFRYRSTLLP